MKLHKKGTKAVELSLSMSSPSEMQAAMDELDRCDISTLLHHLLPRLDAIEQTCRTLEQVARTLLERSAPKSNCTFCPVGENRDNHHSGRCPKYPDPVSKAAQATTLGLCLRCLNPMHEDACLVKCGNCGLGHNFLLCHNRRPQLPAKRHHKH
ncbi:hypothetical protein Y032_0005g2750 [Ancylostoma ceylanicum]|uniref:Uncharacterized protein n=1 Tax=Ancylostoma ceylanicum TaxID=53326 RepID=A0A016VSS1_9BILA|nr:hypothetical protein Y032_0005g2750 [Ancylostoma ceylanicum]